MNVKEAATFLGVGESTIRRYAQVGWLTVRYEKGKTSKRAVYDEDELGLVKTLLEKRGRQRLRPYLKSVDDNSDLVSFRLDEHYRGLLVGRAGERGISAGQYARELIISSLEQHAQVTLLMEDVRSIKLLVQRGREEFALGVKTLIELDLRKDGVEPEEAHQQAAEWVREHLLRPK